MKKYIIIIFFILFGTIYFLFFSKYNECFSKIIILQTASHPTLDYIAQIIKKNIQKNCSLSIIDQYNGQGDISNLNTLSSSIMENSNLRGIVAIGYPALLSLISYGSKHNLKIPIWYCAVSYPEQCGIDKYSGKVFGFSDKIDFNVLIEKIQTLVLKKKIGYLYCINDIGSNILLSQLKEKIDLFEVGINEEIQLADAMELICRNVDVIVIPTDNMIASGIQIVFNIAKKYNKELFVMDKILYEKGHCAYWVGIDYAEQAQQLANKILLE